MSSNNKKPKPLSATSLRNMASKHATRAQTADKASWSRKPIHTRNPEPITLSDQRNMLSELDNVLTEDYIFTWRLQYFLIIIKYLKEANLFNISTSIL